MFDMLYLSAVFKGEKMIPQSNGRLLISLILGEFDGQFWKRPNILSTSKVEGMD